MKGGTLVILAFTLVLLSSAQVLGQAQHVLIWEKQSSERFNTPLCGGIDGDGNDDLVITDNTGKIHVFKHNGEYININWPFQMETTPEGRSISPALVDLNGDQKLDIITGADKTDSIGNHYSGKIYALDYQGNFISPN